MIRIHPLTTGTIRAAMDLFEEGKGGAERVLPVMAFLIEHPGRGRAVFDTGLSPAYDGVSVIGRYHCSVPAGHDVAARLRALDVDPDRIERLVVSHSHFDHIGAADLLPNADLFIHRAECEAALAEDETRQGRISLGLGHRRVLTGETHDLFGDGSCELFATPGHTCGHQSLRVKRAGGYDVLAGDACYFCETLRDEGMQPYPHDRERYLATLRRFRAMADAGDLIVPGHDLGFLEGLPATSVIQVSAAPAAP